MTDQEFGVLDDSNVQAQVAADFVCCGLMHRHRGVLEWDHPRCAVVFGNDGYGDPANNEPSDARARTEVEILRQYLADNAIKELAFAVCRDRGQSWAMIVESDGELDMEEHYCPANV